MQPMLCTRCSGDVEPYEELDASESEGCDSPTPRTRLVGSQPQSQAWGVQRQPSAMAAAPAAGSQQPCKVAYAPQGGQGFVQAQPVMTNKTLQAMGPQGVPFAASQRAESHAEGGSRTLSRGMEAAHTAGAWTQSYVPAAAVPCSSGGLSAKDAPSYVPAASVPLSGSIAVPSSPARGPRAGSVAIPSSPARGPRARTSSAESGLAGSVSFPVAEPPAPPVRRPQSPGRRPVAGSIILPGAGGGHSQRSHSPGRRPAGSVLVPTDRKSVV